MGKDKMDLNNKDVSLLSSYQYADGKIVSLPEGVRFIGGALDLTASYVDMIPAGLKGIDTVIFSDLPKFIAPDYTGKVYVEKFNRGRRLHDLKTYKDRYVRCQKFMEMPRYLNGAQCTLPKDMRFFKLERGYYLDLTKTSVQFASSMSGITRIFTKTQAPELFKLDFPKKISSHKGIRASHNKTKIKD